MKCILNACLPCQVALELSRRADRRFLLREASRGAVLLPAAPKARTTELSGRPTDLVEIQRTLEPKTLRQRLMDYYGLVPEKMMTKINGLSDRSIIAGLGRAYYADFFHYPSSDTRVPESFV